MTAIAAGPARLRAATAERVRGVRPALAVLLTATALLYLAGLSRNGWANDFYTAAVQAGTHSWKAFFFGSFDASNFITVDKTPASLWVMELSARLFGLNYWSVLLPQALEGVGSVALLYAAVRRWFGPGAGLLAGAALALTPVATLMFRFNNPDALLVLLMTGAAYALVRAIESGRTRWLVLAGALLGLGFLTKMLQAFLVGPAFGLAYLVTGPPRLRTRMWQLLAALGALIVAAGWWVAAVMLTPAADRPYVGGSTSNSILQLTLGYNGLGRITGNETGSVGFTGGRGSGPAFGGSAGLGRLFASEMGGQISWLLPGALLAIAALGWLAWRAHAGRSATAAPGTGPGRPALRTDRALASGLVWGGWLVITGAVFSFMAGIIHPYYGVALAPSIAALVGIGAVGLWRQRADWTARSLLAVGVVVTAGWSYALLDRSPGWYPALRYAIVVLGFAAAAVLLAAPGLAGRRWPTGSWPPGPAAGPGPARAVGTAAGLESTGSQGDPRQHELVARPRQAAPAGGPWPAGPGAGPWPAGPGVAGGMFAGRPGMVAAPGPVARMSRVRAEKTVAGLAAGAAVIAALAGPAAYSLNTAATAHTGALPTAGPAVTSSFGGPGGAGPAGGAGGFGRGVPAGQRAGSGSAGVGSGPAGAGAGSGSAGSRAGSAGAGPGGTGLGTPGRTGGVPGSGARRAGSGQPSGGFPGRAGGFGGGPGGLGGSTQVSKALGALLERNASSYTWAAATVGSESAAPLQLATGRPIMSLGGFNGTDPTPTLATFQRLVAEYKIHYFVGANAHSFGGGSGDARAITQWVAAHYRAQTMGGETVYNLTVARPAA